MSRIGKKPIEIPKDVKIDIKEREFRAKGQKGELSFLIPNEITVTVADNNLFVNRMTDSKTVKALHGLTRSLLSNIITGVSNGYERVLSISGVGYRAQVKEGKLIFSLGYSHPVEFPLPAGISAKVDEKQTTITLGGIDKHLLGQVASDIKRLRFPDAYKGKGIRYSGERLKLKAGKTGKK